jgi:cytochrome c-type biogenesis protein CcmH
VTPPLVLLSLLLVLAILVAAYVLWPLLRRDADPAGGADAAAISRAVLRERRRELEASLAHLPADAPERRAALAEFAAQAENELSAAPAASAPAADAPRPAARRRPWAALAIALALGLPTFAMYLLAGAPQAASPEMRAREPANLDELVADLRARLKTDPKALDGWRLLGRAELARGQPEAAREAFERALALAPDDAQARVDLADALAQSQGAVLEGRPIELIREALKIDARNPKALALAGAYEVSRRDYPAAIALWTQLLSVLPADSEQARQVQGFLEDLRAGRAPRIAARPEGEGAAPQAAGAAPPAASAAPPAAGAAPPTAGASVLRGRVEIERGLAARLRPDDTLFVVARTLDDAGRPVGPPVAVMRARGADLPLEFELDDRMAMSPAASLSAVAPGTQLVVVARLSRSGEASARPGDLQGASAPVRPGASGLRVLIDRVVD